MRLIGNISANPITGQLTTTFDEQEVSPLAGTLPKGLPQAPFKSVTLSFDGSQSVLTSPPTCSPRDHHGHDGTVVDAGLDDRRRQQQLHAVERARRRHLPDDARRAQVHAEPTRPSPTTPRPAPTARSRSTSAAPTASRS